MNIIITLPIILVAEIANGHKQVEIRKHKPFDFDTENDVVWVKVKGSDKVAMCLEISFFEESQDTDDVWQRYKNVIGVPFAWWHTYVCFAHKVVIWHIKRIHIFMPHLCFSQTFPGKKAPQSFIYTDVTLQSIMLLVKSVRSYETDGVTRRELPQKKAIQ